MGYPHTQQLHLEEIVLLEVEQEELLHDDMLREEYREESVDCDSEEDIIHDFILVYEEVCDFGLCEGTWLCPSQVKCCHQRLHSLY